MAALKTNRSLKKNQTSAEKIEAAHLPSTLATDASPSNPDVLRALYAALLKTRMLEEHVLGLLRAGKIPGVPVPNSSGIVPPAFVTGRFRKSTRKRLGLVFMLINGKSVGFGFTGKLLLGVKVPLACVLVPETTML